MRAIRRLAASWIVVAAAAPVAAQSAGDAPDLAMYARIRDEGLSRSKVTDYAFELLDRIGARLSGSPDLDRAVAWAVDRMTDAGLSNVRRDRWGEFGMGWRQRNTSVALVEPDTASLPATAAPWSPPTGTTRWGCVRTARSTRCRCPWPSCRSRRSAASRGCSNARRACASRCRWTASSPAIAWMA